MFLGYASGMRQTTNSNLLIIDNQDRTSAALEQQRALIYGIFDATSSNQQLYLNSNVFVKHDLSTTSTSAIYMGDKDTDGTWKIVRNGTDLEFSRRESGNYVTKSVITA